jgi:hypothetical protein
MAQPMLNLGGDLTPEQALQQQQIARQQKMAELLMQQGQQTPSGQMVGNRYVAPSFFQYAAPLLQGYVGKKQLEKAEQEQLNLAKAVREQGKLETQRLMNLIGGRPATSEQVTEMAGPFGEGVGQGNTNIPMPVATMAAQPAIEANPRIALAEALNMQSPQARALLPTILERAMPKPVTPTPDIQNFEFAKNQGFKGSFTDFKNQITPYQQAQLNFDREKFEFEKGKTATKPLPEGLNKQVTGAVNLTDAIADYQTKIKGFGFKDFANPDKRAEMGNLYNNMMLQAKEAYNLGVLNGPDYDILQRVVKDPTNVSSLAFSNTALSKQADSLRKTSSDIVKNAYLSQGREVPADISAKFVKKEEPKTEKKSVKEQLSLSKVPKGVDPKVWNVMTPEEKDLFK